MPASESPRAVVDECIARFALDLGGIVVATEAATSHFAWTAALAARAGARKVFAFSRDTRHGPASAAIEATKACAEELGVGDTVVPTTSLACLEHAGIVTNLHMLRPFTRETIMRMRADAVLPLMWETWEHRPGELDLGACFERGVLVLGTKEAHPTLCFMRYVGELAVRLLSDTRVPLEGAPILVVGGGRFAHEVMEKLRAERANPAQRVDGGAPLGTIAAVVVADHESEDIVLDCADLSRCMTATRGLAGLPLVHISGRIEVDAFRAAGIRLFPEAPTNRPRTMSITPAHLGPRPVIELHAAGLKVGEEMHRARARFPSDYFRARDHALLHPLCQDFALSQYHAYGISPPARSETVHP